ncbi:hypothetical protein B0J14DRAFT_9788 [Halenospora varia]|nr:hypothetical protein B0J14DRAFT_9788 [Halenospora varia]
MTHKITTRCYSFHEPQQILIEGSGIGYFAYNLLEKDLSISIGNALFFWQVLKCWRHNVAPFFVFRFKASRKSWKSQRSRVLQYSINCIRSNPLAKMAEHETTPPTFYRYAQNTALAVFLPILTPYLPYSNCIYNRASAPQNHSSRHCLFASTIPLPSTHPQNDDSTPSTPSTPENFTMLFTDRSRHNESQIWIFNPLIEVERPLTNEENQLLLAHVKAAILFIKNTEIPEAPGWPFDPILRFSTIHERIAGVIHELCDPSDAIPRETKWNHWNVSTKDFDSNCERRRPLPPGYTVTRLPDDQISIVVSTSSMPRQPSTLKSQANIGIMNASGKFVAWVFLGLDGSLATLFVLPEERGKGLATQVAVELLRRVDRGEFADLGIEGKSGWVHSDVKVGNEASEGVMRSLGGKVGWTNSYLWVDTEKFF